MTTPEIILENAGIRPTSNRVTVVRALLSAQSPLSLAEIEDRLETLERSSILRVLNLLHDHHAVHVMEDGRGVTKYEVCHSHEGSADDDVHVHFYCERCRRVYCFDHIVAPPVAVPDGFDVSSVNYMIKGTCPACGKK